MKTLKFFKRTWIFLLISMLFTLLQTISSLQLPSIVGSIISEVIEKENTSLLMNYTLEMVLVTIIVYISAVTAGFFASKVTTSLQYDMRKAVFNKTQDMSLEEMTNFDTSSLITRTVQDINLISQFLSMFFRMGILAPVMGIGAVFMAYSEAKDLSWIILVTVSLLSVVVITLVVIAMPKSTKIQKLVDRLNQTTRDSLTGVRVIRAFNAEDAQYSKFSEANDNYYKNNVFLNVLMGGLMPLVFLLSNFGIILVLYFGAELVDMNTIEVSSIVVYIQYLNQIIMAFLLVGMIISMVPRFITSNKRVNEVLGTVINIKNKEKTVKEFKTKGEIEFKSVDFKYPDSNECILKNIDLKIKKGQKVAFIGSTGSGKSTIINLIPRFYDVTSGSILVNSVDVKDQDLIELREKISFVSQTKNLFKGSIKDNLLIAGKEYEANIEKALRVSQSSDFVSQKEGGLEFMLSQQGKNLSGGQRQRLCIARALVKESEVLILDDSLSALDYKTASKLQAALSEEYQDLTVLTVAQRVSSIMSYDQIVVLNEGLIDSIGTHKELLKSSSIYYEIASSQLTKEELENA